MAVPASLRTTPLRTDDEHAVHYFARESWVALRWAVRILLVITALTMVTFWFWAIVPATLLVITYLLLLLTREVERRSRRAADADQPEPAARAEASISGVTHTEVPAAVIETDDQIVSMPLLKHEVLVISAGVAAVVIIAVILAAIFFGGGPALLAALFFFAYIGFMGGPVWLAAFEDDIEMETEREHTASS